MNNQLPETIQAHAGDALLPHLQFRVPLDVLFEELLQNARRAHAKQIQIVVADSGAGRTTVTVGDDGRGVTDPSVLLDAGRSGWDTPIAAIESVSGLGFFALAPYGCQVISHPVPESGFPQWTAILEPVHFTGRRTAPVVRTHVELGNQATGTALHFTLPEDPDTVAAAVKDAARYFTLPVHFSDNGPKNLQPLPQQDILDGAILQEEWNDVTIAVRESRVRYDEPDLCVAGRPFHVDLPVVYTPDGGFFATVAYAHHCRDLEFRDVTADLALACPSRVIRKSAANARLVIRTDHDLTPNIICDILHQGFFDPCDGEPDLNRDFDNYLHDRNEQTAQTVAAFILHGPEAAVRTHYQHPKRLTLPDYLKDRFDVHIDVKLTPRVPGRDKT